MKNLVCIFLVLLATPAWATRSQLSMGFNFGVTATDQKDLDLLISRANSRAGGISTSAFGNAWEGGLQFGYRFEGSMTSLIVRPSIFYQNEEGSGSDGNYNYGVMAYSIFPIFRFTLLEDETVAFFTQLGLGWGYITGEIEEAGSKVEFSGDDMGYMVGLGAEFCVFSEFHCIVIEGNARTLFVERIIADSASGSFAGNSLSQAQTDQEVEVDGRDLGVSMSGIQGIISYVMYF